MLLPRLRQLKNSPRLKAAHEQATRLYYRLVGRERLQKFDRLVQDCDAKYRAAVKIKTTLESELAAASESRAKSAERINSLLHRKAANGRWTAEETAEATEAMSKEQALAETEASLLSKVTRAREDVDRSQLSYVSRVGERHRAELVMKEEGLRLTTWTTLTLCVFNCVTFLRRDRGTTDVSARLQALESKIHQQVMSWREIQTNENVGDKENWRLRTQKELWQRLDSLDQGVKILRRQQQGAQPVSSSSSSSSSQIFASLRNNSDAQSGLRDGTVDDESKGEGKHGIGCEREGEEKKKGEEEQHQNSSPLPTTHNISSTDLCPLSVAAGAGAAIGALLFFSVLKGLA